MNYHYPIGGTQGPSLDPTGYSLHNGTTLLCLSDAEGVDILNPDNESWAAQHQSKAQNRQRRGEKRRGNRDY